MISPIFYYQLLLTSKDKCLTYKKTKESNKPQLFLYETAQNSPLESIWMVKQTQHKDAFSLLHCSTGLTLQNVPEQGVSLQTHKNKNSQQFILKKLIQQPNCYLIRQKGQEMNLLKCTNNALTCTPADESRTQAHWQIRRVVKNQEINKTCIISNVFSGHVLAGDQSQKDGKKLRQEHWTGLFHQRWTIVKDKDFFRIKNLKSGLQVGISSKIGKKKEGMAVVQCQHNTQTSHQLWSIEERGFQVYAVRTALDQQLYMAVQKRSLQGGAQIQLAKDQNKHLWKIVGNFQ